MTGKRKRVRPSARKDVDAPQKCIRTNVDQKSPSHPTLSLYYDHILTLREYVLSKLPEASKTRRRKILSVDYGDLDKTLICSKSAQQPRSDSSRSEDFEAFTQRVSLSTSSSGGERSPSQSDLIDFAVWLLFHRIYRHAHKPPHMLCHGYYRAHNSKLITEDHGALAGIPGIVSHYPNNNIEDLKNVFWTNLLDLLGKGGDGIMLDLVLDCGIFIPVDRGQGNYSQLSGRPQRNLTETELNHLPRDAIDRITRFGDCELVQGANVRDKGFCAEIQAGYLPSWSSSQHFYNRICS